jgi:hypothetical protein
MVVGVLGASLLRQISTSISDFVSEKANIGT